MLPATVLTSTNKYTRVTTCTNESSHLIIIPKYYFKEDIEYWILSDVGYYYGELLINSSQDNRAIFIFRWFKFTLKPPYRIVIGNFFSAIWDTSHWNFLVKFGLKTA